MKYRIYALLTLLGILFSCSKDEHEVITPEVNTVAIEMITEEGAYVSGNYTVPPSTKIIDHGFLYYLDYPFQQGPPKYSQMYKLSLGPSDKNELEFYGNIRENLIKGERFIFCSFVKTDQNIMYGETLPFTSQCGEIDGWVTFSPHTANIGDTITINGKYLQVNSYVHFNNKVQQAFHVTDTLLKVTVPDEIDMLQFPLKVYVARTTYQSKEELHINPPTIDSVSKKFVVNGDQIELYGKNLTFVDEISLGGKKLEKRYYDFQIESHKKIKLSVPRGIKVGKLPLSIKYMENTASFDNLLEGILPVIESFSPCNVWYNDTVIIKGKNLHTIYTFKHPSLTYTNTSIVSQSDTMMKLIVRNIIPEDTLCAYYNDYEVKTNSKLSWTKPSITSIDKKVIYGTDNLILKGEKFITGTRIRLGNEKSDYANVPDENTLETWIQAKAGKHKIALIHDYDKVFDTITDFEVEVLKAEITDISPKTFMRGQKLRISTKNIPNPSNGYAQFKLKDRYLHILEQNDNEFLVQFQEDIPMENMLDLTLEYGVQKFEFAEQLTFTEPWQNAGESYFETGVNYIGICNGKHTLIDNDNIIYQFNQTSESWESFATIDLPNVYYSQSTVYKDKLILSYFNNGHELAIYSMTDKTLTKIERDERQEKLSGNIFSFLNGDEFYLGSDYIFLSFNLSTNTWTEKSMTPEKLDIGHKTISFTINNQGYMAFEHRIYGDDSICDFWKYDFANDEWIQLDGFNTYISNQAASTIHNNKAYIVHHGENGMKGVTVYDPANNSWQGFVPPPGDGYNYLIFESNGYLYFSNYIWSSSSIKSYKMPIDELIPLEN